MIYKFKAIQQEILESTVEADTKEEALEKIKCNEYSTDNVILTVDKPLVITDIKEVE